MSVLAAVLLVSHLAMDAPAVDTAPAGAQPDTTHHWVASTAYEMERLAGGRGTWREMSMSAGRRSNRLTMLGELDRQVRFGVGDNAVALDGYYMFAKPTYANLRVAVSPGAEVTARLDASGEVFHSVGATELSVGYDRREYAATGVDVVALGVGRYVGDWYLRSRVSLASQAGAHGITGGVLARRYLGSTDHFLGLQAGVGQDIVVVAAGAEALRRTEFIATRYAQPLSGSLGLTIGTSWTGEQGISSRWGTSAGVSLRW